MRSYVLYKSIEFKYELQVLPKLDHSQMEVTYESFGNKHKRIISPNPNKTNI